jgi:DNA-binding phage protein
MFPKASLTGRIVRTNNTMRMAKSWGHSGGPVPKGAKPRFETIATIMRALNVGFSVESRLPARAKSKLKAA